MKTDRPSSRTSAWTVVLAALAATLAGCVAPTTGALKPAGASEAPLFAATSPDGSSCTAFTNAQIDRADFYLQAVMNTQTFWDCIGTRLNAYDPACASRPPGMDPSGATTLPTQIANIRRVIYAGNHLAPNCSYTGPNYGYQDLASGDTWNSQNTSNGIYLNGEWSQDYASWSSWTGFAPWAWQPTTLIHEFLHEHGYDDAGPCGFVHSANYLVGNCVRDIIYDSQCPGSGNILDYCADPEAVNLPGAWDVAGDQPDQNPANCICVKGLRHRMALRTYNNYNFVSAINGGGGAVDAQAIGFGSWEATHVIDLTLMKSRNPNGLMNHLDYVQFRAPNGNLWRANGGLLYANSTSTANNIVDLINTSDPSTFRIRWVGGSGGGVNGIVNGSVISIQAYDGRYLSANNGGGSSMTADRASVGVWEKFTVQEPRRAWFASIRSLNSSAYLSYASGGALGATVTAQDDSTAFWIVDHNGGQLRSGDPISFESDLNTGQFVQTCTNGTGQVRADAASMRSCSKFYIVREAGDGLVQAGDVVSFLSSQSRWLTAIPPGSGGTVQNYATSIGYWERFTFDLYAPTAGPPYHPAWTVD